jgi:regulatory protein
MERRITALVAQKHHPDRVSVYLDGEFAFGLARIVAAWLAVGQALSEEKIASLKAADAQESAYLHALKLLSYRPRSAEEVRQNLEKHAVAPEAIEAAIERLQRAGLLNDAAFAQAWVDNRTDFRPRSRRALAYELQRKGVPAELVEQSLEAVDDEALALQAASKYARRLEALEWPEFRRKLAGFLGRRGFSYATADPVIRQVYENLHAGKQGVVSEEDFEDE